MYMYTPKSISNVTLFNNYIYLNISKTKNICNETLNEYIKYLNSVQVNPTHTDDFDTYYTQLSKMLIYKDKDLQDPINYSSYLEGLLLFNGNHLSDDAFTGWKFIDNICALYLIGTPEDVEELSMLPGIFIREVYDKTSEFIFDDINIHSTLHSKSQLIIYKIGTYYASEPKWWKNWKNNKDMRFFREQDFITLYDIHDVPYSECPVFRKPSLSNNGIIYPCYKQHLNPDERVYKICIQMTDNLIRKSYERSNFFIIIRNQKEKMSIKNFIKYLS